MRRVEQMFGCLTQRQDIDFVIIKRRRIVLLLLEDLKIVPSRTI
jgi:hypothetical protein